MRLVLKTVGLITASLFTLFAQAQPIYKIWDNTLQSNNNGSVDGRFLQLLKTSESSFLSLCSSPSASAYDKSCNAFNWLIGYDLLGNKLWDKCYTEYYPPGGLQMLNPSTFVFSLLINASDTTEDINAPLTPGTPTIGNSQRYGIGLLAVDTLGNKLWNKRFGAGTDTVDGSYRAIVPNDIKAINGSIYVLGTAMAIPAFSGGDLTVVNCLGYPGNVASGGHGGYLKDFLLYKVSGVNDSVYSEWQHLYGGEWTEGAHSLLPLSDGGFLIGGITNSAASCNQTVSAYYPYDSTQAFTPYNKTDFYLVRTDSVGNILWQKVYGGIAEEWLLGLVDAGNNEYMAYGYTTSWASHDVSSSGFNNTSLWVVKMDSAGNKIWDKRYSGCQSFYSAYISSAGGDPDLKDQVVDAINTHDGGILFLSNVRDSLPCGDVSEAGKGDGDYWLLKIDSAGNKLWDKSFGGPGADIAQRIIEMSPGYYVIGGTSHSQIGGDKTEATIGPNDLWLVGVVDSSIATSVKELTMDNGQLTIVPNPAKDNVEMRIQNSKLKTQNLFCRVYDITGKLQLQQQLSNTTTQQLNISTLSSGIYIVEVRDNKGFAVRGKLVKE